jgi:hypothetical protein
MLYMLYIELQWKCNNYHEENAFDTEVIFNTWCLVRVCRETTRYMSSTRSKGGDSSGGLNWNLFEGFRVMSLLEFVR